VGIRAKRRATGPGARVPGSSATGLAATILAAVFSIGALGGCGGGGSEAALAIEVATVPSPASVGPTELVLAIRDEAGAPLAGAEVRIEATMAHAGMVPEFADAEEIEAGRYRAELELTMGGDWLLIVDVVLADGTEVQQVVPLNGVRPKRTS